MPFKQTQNMVLILSIIARSDTYTQTERERDNGTHLSRGAAPPVGS